MCGRPRRRPVLRALGRVLGDLADLGYDARWYGLRAADVGAAHGRFRIFLFATPADADVADGMGGAPRHGRATAQERDCSSPGVAKTAGHGRAPDPAADAAVNDMGAAYTPETWDEWTAKMQAEHGNGNGHGKSLSIEALRLLPTPTTRDHKGRNQRDDDTCLTGASCRRHAPPGWLAHRDDDLLPTPRMPPGHQAAELDQARQDRANLIEVVEHEPTGGATTPQPSPATPTPSDAQHPTPPSPASNGPGSRPGSSNG